MKKLSTLDESVSSPLRMEQLTSETTGKRQQEGRNNHKREKSPEEKPNKLQNAVRRLKSMRQNTIKTLSSNESDTEQQEFKPTTDSHQQNQINQEEDDRPLAEIMFGGDYDQDEQNMQTNSFKRRVSRVLNKIDQSNDNSRRNTLAKNELSQSKRNSFLEKSKQQKVDFNMVPNLDIPNKRSGARMFLNERQNDSTNNDNQMQNAGYETGEDNKNSLDRAPQMPTLTKSTSEYRSQTNKVQVPQLNITNLGASKSSLTKNPFQEEDLNIQMQQSRNATLKYCSAIQLYYLGDLKQSFVIHSLSPVLNRVEISIRPQVVQNIPYGEETSRWQLEQIPDWQCAPALKSQGEVFRILPAVDHNYIKKIRKILKNKKELDPHNQFKYGEYLESLNEEMKYNLDVFEEYKNQYVKFGSQVMIMHENSQLFLKISSPSLLKLTPYISEKTMFKLLPSSKIQSEGEGKILENDQFFLGYTYDKILNKDLYLFQDPVQLERSATKKKSSLEKFENFNLELLFSESKKLPLHFGICESLDFDRSENIFKHLNGKVIQIKHIESELYLSQTIKRKENRILSQFFGSTNRYQLNKLIDYIPKVYGNEASVNVHFEPRASINTYWKVYASPHHRDAVFLENAVSKVRIKGLHLNAFSKGGARNENGEESLFYKIFQEENTLSSSLNVKRSSIHEISAEREYLWVEYLKFNRTENKYEFSKFGSMKDEDKGNLFDTFKIYTVDSYQQHSFEFLHHCFNSLKSFDSYQADNPECQEYERILKVIIQLKRFVQNKLSGLINVDEPYGEPNLTNQNLYKESFIIDEIIEIVDLIWPDENYMRKDFSGKSLQELNDVQSDEESFNSSTFSHNSDVHRETKVKLAEKIFELLKLICHDNFVLKEFVFFDIVPNIQKFVKLFLNNSTFQFGAGFRKQQDFQLFNYLVQDCDQYADYKEKTKYNIIFQFMKKLYVYINIILISQQKDNTSKVESNLFSILRSFCINPKGQPNNYHQKLLHDLFFFNQLEGIKFKLNQKPISAVKQSVKRSTVVIQNEDQLSVRKLQEDLKKFDENKFNKSQSLRALRSETQSKLQKNTNTRSNKLLQPIKEIRMDFGSKISDHDENKEEDNNLLSFVTTKSKGKKGQSFASSAQKDKKEQINEEMESHMESDYEELRVETIEDESFLIKRIHDITFNKLTSKVILENTKDSNLIKLELYFFADLCYLMNFDCPCSKFSSATVHNLLKLLTNKKSKLDTNIKAGLARILNTILRNHDDNVHSRPYFLRMYEKQEFVPPHGQVIISNEDTRSLVKLTRENFRLMSIQHSYNFSDFDFEMMRLTQYVIQSNLVFQKDFNEGYLYVTDIFEDIGGMFIRRKEIEKNQKISSSKSHLSILTNDQQSETTLNISEFQKQFKKMKQILDFQINIFQESIAIDIGRFCIRYE
ncbi:UNKNOWN [Stylonychia lemnae]|uniref:Uncharacterized protein n=1 Tax=Stylonychia lemnae TaxID=5949 RepID=A0A078A3X9_STYLE|nr:UNKNOWN [Stylonychia lemnae]|eukprot:CDW76579.1 UNKNOWN [Stylonychia lemnae]